VTAADRPAGVRLSGITHRQKIAGYRLRRMSNVDGLADEPRYEYQRLVEDR
jgi:hypothetical protein